MQNPHPQKILYHIHDNMKWLPLIMDPCEKHPIEENDGGDDDEEALEKTLREEKLNAIKAKALGKGENA